MGLLIAVITGLSASLVFNSKLYSGKYSFTLIFWAFGIIGSLLLIIPAIWYIINIAQADLTSRGWFTLSAIRAVSAPLALYFFVVFIGLWRSSTGMQFKNKVSSRYFSVLYFVIALGLCILSWFNLIIAITVHFLKLKLLKSKKSTN